MATICKSLGISLETTFTSKNGRPMKIANGGKVIKELFLVASRSARVRVGQASSLPSKTKINPAPLSPAGLFRAR